MSDIREEGTADQENPQGGAPADQQHDGGQGAEQPPKEVSTREAITQALKDAKQRDEDANAAREQNNNANAPAADAKTGKTPEGKAAEGTGDAAKDAEAAGAVKVPNSWPVHLRGDFAKLDPKTQKWIAEREKNFALTVAKQDEDRNLGKTMKEIAAPYEQIFRAENTTPDAAFKTLLNMAYICRRGTPQQKTALILQTAKDFNISIPGYNAPGGNGQQGGQPQNQFVAQLQNTIQGLQNTVSQLTTRLNDRETTERNHADAALSSTIQAFASDPKHQHFETVMPQMTALLNAGAAKDLDDAYNQAIWAHPELRETLLPEQVNALAAKQKQANAAKVQNAKKAGSSIAGSPGRNAPAAPKIDKNASTRDIIKASIDEVRGNT